MASAKPLSYEEAILVIDSIEKNCDLSKIQYLSITRNPIDSNSDELDVNVALHLPASYINLTIDVARQKV